ncbi:MaoC family dehydratase [Auritidibacter ignavus]|uniref:MaoC family dehydratase n=1 Tax=Auritidibacter ignavus TaxID=678932 RepID=UPI00244822A2|nr:MaoC family dehydratase [Auritidibacter ignavus]WGH81081.1 MaoC family dehydratase [Auritidibacter ignavus]WHS35896.1 MaoC family dehydratase [Auritidibacter ignavus]
MLNDVDQLTFDSMRVGDRLKSIQYQIDEPVHNSFIHSALVPQSVRSILDAEDPFAVAHPMQTLTDYLALIEETYAPMGTGLHTRHESTLFRPMPLRQNLTATGTIVDTYVKRNRDYWTADYEVQDDKGVLVRHRMTATVDRPKTPGEANVTRAPTPNRADKRQNTEWSDANSSWTTHAEHTIDMSMIVEYDRQYWLRRGHAHQNPPNAHTSREIARLAGLPDAVMHSSHYYTWLSNIALEVFGARWLSSGKIEARFVAPAFPGDTLRLQSNRDEQHSLKLRVVGPHDAVVAVGSCQLHETDSL